MRTKISGIKHIFSISFISTFSTEMPSEEHKTSQASMIQVSWLYLSVLTLCGVSK